MIGSTSAIDRVFHYALAKQTGGVSPAALMLSYTDWALHLSMAPGTRLQLGWKFFTDAVALQRYTLATLTSGDLSAGDCPPPAKADRRFAHEDWQRFPFNVMQQSFLVWENLWDAATTNVHGVSKEHEQAVNFLARQMLDMVAPSNFVATNPELLDKTTREGGFNLMRGAMNLLEDKQRNAAGLPPAGVEEFKVGKTLAVTPGKVVARTRLMELIQYSPTTAKVHPNPVLIVPAWIMKYYILDLSAKNSLIKYMVDQGFTVFAISWKNPDESYADTGMDDYRRLGIMEALKAISQIVPNRKVHALGYCLGGTLLSIAAAAMARDGDDRLKSMTLLAAQTDFSQPGELELFVNESQLAFLEDMMEERGYLSSAQMAGAFQLLRSNDLIWSHMIHDYMLGERTSMMDLMAWNADPTRMPARMHSEYLRDIFMGNQLAEGRFHVDGRSIALRDITAPIFVVGTETDHVAPWRSVYQINVLSDTDVTFVLTSGGHNAGIVSEPGRKHRHYRIATSRHDTPYVGPETWHRTNAPKDGSWWPEWAKWLRAGSSEAVQPPKLGAPNVGYPALCDAPGTYVFE